MTRGVHARCCGGRARACRDVTGSYKVRSLHRLQLLPDDATRGLGALKIDGSPPRAHLAPWSHVTWMHLVCLLLWQLWLCLSGSLAVGVDVDVARPPYDAEIDHGTSGSYPVRRLKTTKLTPPHTNFPTGSPECAFEDAHYFLTPKGHKVPSPGPMILNSNGDLIWSHHFDNEFGGQAYDLQVQKYREEQYLTFWLGDDRIRGHGAGHFYMLNSSYDIVRKIGAVNGQFADLHEFLITPEGTALIVIFEVIPFDVRPAGRKFNDVWNQYIWDCLIQEVDIATENLVFEWRASEHLDITTSYKTLIDRNDGTPTHPYDPFHFNSVEKDSLGNYLVSARYTHAIYYISGSTSKVIWTLGGKNNNFMDLSGGDALNFAWQHDARFISPTAFPRLHTPEIADPGVSVVMLSLFDNAAEDWNYDYGPDHARGLLLELTYSTPKTGVEIPKLVVHDDPSATVKTNGDPRARDKVKLPSINGTNSAYSVRVIKQYINTNAVRSSSQGSMQVLPPEKYGEDSDVLVGYGINGAASTFSGNGTLLCDMHFGAVSGWEKGDVQSYRALKFKGWIGKPRNPPDVVRKGDTVWVSWNGATEVREWVIETSVSGESGNKWTVVIKTPKRGFETEMTLPTQHSGAKHLRIVALDRDGKVCEHGIAGLAQKTLRTWATGHSWYWYGFWFVVLANWIYWPLVHWRQYSEAKKENERYKLP